MSDLWNRVRRAFRVPRPRGVERDVDDEIRFHLESRVQELLERGHSLTEACAVARREFGDLEAARTELTAVDRGMRAREQRADWFDALRHDLVFSVRALRRSRWVTAMIVVLLALGVGANAATYSLADALFVRPPAGVRNSGEILRLYERSKHSANRSTVIDAKMPYVAYAQIADALKGRATVAAYTPPDSAFARDRNGISQVRISFATPSYFTLLGVHAHVGRTFVADEARMAQPAPVAVISDGLWARRFGRDPSVIGSTIELQLERYTVVGVTPKDFTGTDLDRTDIWLPMSTYPQGSIGDQRWYDSWVSRHIANVLVRPRSEFAANAIAAAATTVVRRAELATYGKYADSTVAVVTGPILEMLGPSITPNAVATLTTRLLAVSLIVLLIACANVANLLVLRGLRRRREVALRLALGIPHSRLMRQLLFESLVISLIAAACATLLAWWGAAWLRALVLPTTHWGSSALNGRVIAEALLVAIGTGLVAGVAPTIGARRIDLNAALKRGEHGETRRARLRPVLVAAQAALSVLLLVGAGLFVHSVHAVEAIDLGYDVDRVVSGLVYFRDPTTRAIEFQYDQPATLAAGLRDVQSRLRSDPDVEGVALTASAPMWSYAMTRAFRADGTPIPQLDNYDLDMLMVSPDYFSVAGIRLLRGRLPTTEDQSDATPAIVVGETAARVLWPNQDPLRQCLIMFHVNNPCARVVGVTTDTHVQDIVESPRMLVFEPIKHPSAIVVRARPGRAAAVANTLRAELARTFPTAEPPLVTDLGSLVAPQLRPWRVGALLFSAFGALALIVAAIGAYSVLAYAVAQRTHEIGVRMALGARRRQIASLVLRQGMRAVAVGIVIGVIASLAASRALTSLLYGTKPTDPLVYATVAVLLAGAGAVACLVPSWRATRVDPMSALRVD